MKRNIKKEYFDSQVKAIYRENEKGILLNRHKEILKYVNKYFSKESRILDVGCFDGKILRALEKDGYRNLYGLDFSETSKKCFNKSLIHFASYDIESDEVPFSGKFDVIIYSDVLEHLFLPQTVLLNIKSKLSARGMIMLSVPNAGWFLNGVLLSFFPSKLFISTAFGPWGHTCQFTFYEINKIAQQLGFNIIQLSGGKIDNYIFKKGPKKILYDVFLVFLNQLMIFWPQLFSDHIFAVLQNIQKQ